MVKIEIKDSCTGCGICVKKCPTVVFDLKDKKADPARVQDCMACRYCEVVCPQKSIEVIECY
jgi:2-oxoglutarate ferredoxin oxidoreductase subunit delta